MRIRITRARHGEIDGFALDTLHVGQVYDLPTALGTYLVITASAEVVEGDRGVRVFPFETRFDMTPSSRAVAADRGTRPKDPDSKK